MDKKHANIRLWTTKLYAKHHGVFFMNRTKKLQSNKQRRVIQLLRALTAVQQPFTAGRISTGTPGPASGLKRACHMRLSRSETAKAVRANSVAVLGDSTCRGRLLGAPKPHIESHTRLLKLSRTFESVCHRRSVGPRASKIKSGLSQVVTASLRSCRRREHGEGMARCFSADDTHV